MRWLRAAGICTLLGAVLFGSGCWDNVELNRRAIVAGMAVDVTDEGLLAVTLQVIRPPRASSTEQRYENINATGASLSEAFRAMDREAPHFLFFASQRLLAISVDAAKLGLLRIIDAQLREREPRETTEVALVEGQASALLSVSSAESIPSYGLERLLDEQREVGEVPPVTLSDLIEHLGMGSAYLPVFAISGEGGAARARLVGTELFRGDKPIGRLDLAEGRGINWVMNGVTGGIAHVSGVSDGVSFSFTPTTMNSTIDGMLEGGVPTVRIALVVEGRIGEIGDAARIRTSGGITSLEKATADVIRADIEAALTATRTYQSDLFEIGNHLRSHHPRQWPTTAPNWPGVLAQLKADVNVVVTIRETGLIREAVKPQ